MDTEAVAMNGEDVEEIVEEVQPQPVLGEVPPMQFPFNPLQFAMLMNNPLAQNSNLLPALISNFRAGLESIGQVAQPGDNPFGVDLDALIATGEQRQKRTRAKRKSFAIEDGIPGLDAAGRKRRPQSSSSSQGKEVQQKDPTYYSDLERELTEHYTTAISNLRTVAENIGNSKLVPILGQNPQINLMADKIQNELDLWMKAVSYAQNNPHKARMSAEDQHIINSVLSHYKSQHPEQLVPVMKMLAELFGKQERVIGINFKRFQAKEALAAAMNPGTQDQQDANAHLLALAEAQVQSAEIPEEYLALLSPNNTAPSIVEDGPESAMEQHLSVERESLTSPAAEELQINAIQAVPSIPSRLAPDDPFVQNILAICKKNTDGFRDTAALLNNVFIQTYGIPDQDQL